MPRGLLFFIVAVLLGGVLAACGGAHHAAPQPRQHPHHPRPKPKPKPRHSAGVAPLVVTILDGDRNKRVRGALVRLAGKKGRTGRHGVTTLMGPRRPLRVTVSRHGYETVRVRVNFHRRRQTIRIYQPRLQWPIYGATPARTQAQPHIRLRPPFHIVWSRGLGQLIEFPAVVDAGVAYIGTQFSTIHAVLMRSGKVAWRHVTPGSPRMASSPAVYGDAIVYHTMAGWVYVLDRRNGKLRWSWNAGSAVESSPIIRGGIDYFGTAGGMLDALDLRTHKVRWSHSLGAKITSSVAIDGGRLYIGDYAGRLWSMSAATGATHWTAQVNGKIYGTPAVSQGRVFVPSSDGDSMTAFSTSGRYLWRVSTSNYVYSSPAVWHGRVCFGSYDGWFYGVAAATGHVVWRVYTGGPVSGAAAIVDGVAYAGSEAGRIVGVDLRTGRTVLSFPHGDFVPVSGNGQRLLLNGYNRMYAVEPRSRYKHRRLAR